MKCVRLPPTVLLAGGPPRGVFGSKDEGGKNVLEMEGTMPLSSVTGQLEESGEVKVAEVESARGLCDIKGRRADHGRNGIYVDVHSGEVAKQPPRSASGFPLR